MASSRMLSLTKASLRLLSSSSCRNNNNGGGWGRVAMTLNSHQQHLHQRLVNATASKSHHLLLQTVNRAAFSSTATATTAQQLTEQDIMQQMLEDVEKITYRNFVEKEHNPFAYHSREDFWTKLKVAVGAVTLLPLRLLLVVPLPLIGAAFTKIVLLGANLKSETPLPAWRQNALRFGLRRLTRLFLFGLGFHKIELEGRPAPFEEAPIVVANHMSFVDPLFFIARQLPSAIAKDAVGKLPLFGTMARSMQVIFVDRKAKDSRKATIDEILRRVKYAQDHPGERTFPQVLIFPEGTTTNGSCLITFKNGAFVPGVPVQPVVIKYPHSHEISVFHSNPKSGFAPVCAEPSQLSWVPFGPSGFKLLLRMLCNLNNRMQVKYLEVYCPTAEERADPRLYANNVRTVMAKALGVPITEHTYDDVMLLTQAFEFKLPAASINASIDSLKKKIRSLTVTDVSNLLERFNKVDTGRDGLIGPSEFAAALGVKRSEFTERLFKLFDVDNSGFIDFKEFVVGLAVMSRKVSHEDSIRLAFQAYDTNGDGTLTEDELYNIVRSAWKCVTKEEVHEIFSKFDQKKDGKIDFEEFLSFLRQRPEYLSLFGDPNDSPPHISS